MNCGEASSHSNRGIGRRVDICVGDMFICVHFVLLLMDAWVMFIPICRQL